MAPSTGRHFVTQLVQSTEQWGEHDEHGVRVGKKAAGALLDGVLWRQIPTNLPTTDHAEQEEPSCSTRTH